MLSPDELLIAAPIVSLLPIPLLALLTPPRRAISWPVLFLIWGLVAAIFVVAGVSIAGAFVGYNYGALESEVGHNVTGWVGARKGAAGWGFCFGLPLSLVGFFVGGILGMFAAIMRREYAGHRSN